MHPRLGDALRIGRCGPVARAVGPPAARISRLVAYSVLGKPRKRIAEIEVDREGLRWRLDLAEDAQRLMFLGLYETELRKRVLSDVRGPFVDVGANVGFWSVPAATRTSVVAFEPNPWAADHLRANAMLNDLEIDIRRQAVSSRSGELELYASDLEQNASQATLHRDAIRGSAEQIRVPVVTLDQAVDDVDTLKIDVEGHEEEVLLGATGLLSSRTPRIVVIELLGWRLACAGSTPERVVVLLESHGYHAKLRRPVPEDVFDTVVFSRA
jgi:FkbM family methyltransferase